MATDRDRLIDDAVDLLHEAATPLGTWLAFKAGSTTDSQRSRTLLGVIEASKQRIAAITIDLASKARKGISGVNAWGKEFLRLIGQGHVAGAMAGIGVLAPNPADMDVIDQNIKKQGKFLSKFRKALVSGSLLILPNPGTVPANNPTPLVSPHVLARAEMYADGMYGGTAGVLRARAIRDGFDQERRILGGSSETSCTQCPPLSRKGKITIDGVIYRIGEDGWCPIASLPGIGETVCRVRCRCRFEYRKKGSAIVSSPLAIVPETGSIVDNRNVQAPAIPGIDPQLPTFVRHRQAVREAHDAAIPGLARQLDLTPDQYRDRADKALRSIADEADYYIRARSSVIGKILQAGRIKTQFETGTSGGAVSESVRKGTEARLFGVDPETPAASRPVYGFAARGDFGSVGAESQIRVENYGDAVIRLKPSVRDRSTVTLGDSLVRADSLVGSPASTPTLDAGPLGGAAWGRIHRDLLGDELNPSEKLDLIGSKAGYLEVQYHGGITTDDIAEIAFSKAPSKTVQSQLKEAGIPWRIAKTRTN